MTKDEALKMCLEYIETDAHERKYVRHAIKKALAQPEQDGKCKYCTDGCPACDASKLPEQKSVAMADYMALTEKYVALKAAQRTWVGLTDEEYTELWGMKPDLLNFFRKIEAKLKEKNT